MQDTLVPVSPAWAERAFIDRAKYDGMLDEYYEYRGADKETTLPKPETLQKIGLDGLENWQYLE